MRGQSEIVTFVLLFLIGVILFISAITWSRGLFDRNIDIAKVTAAENFIENLDKKIQSTVSFGGKESLDYNVDGTIQLIDSNPDIIEIKTTADVVVPDYWVNISSPGSSSITQEMLDNTIFRIRLFYPPQEEYKIDLFTEGAVLAKPEYVIIERNDTTTEIVNNEKITVIKIKITFE
jgi:hypothetical protein